MQIERARFPAKLKGIFDHHTYKVLRGGRGGGKSWAVAMALLIIGVQRPIRVLCARETQRSIRDSVHRLLVDQIAALGLQAHYSVKQIEISGANGTSFIFTGLSDQTVAGIKSYERIDMCWVEEAHLVSQNSWTLLLPTLFRTDEEKGVVDGKKSCEVWVTFNPEVDEDYTWRYFIENPPPDTITWELNWRDNPFFPSKLNELREHDKQTRPEWEYNWIWEGKCKPAISGAVYADQLAELFSNKRVGEYPVSTQLPVFAAWDLGYGEATAIVIFQRQVSAVRVVDYIEQRNQLVPYYSKVLREKPYNIKTIFLPHDGKHNHLTGYSVERALQDLGWNDVRVLPQTPIEDGIRQMRSLFPQLYIDSRCERLIKCLKYYRRIIPATTGEPSHPAHDEYSHGADAMRYMAMACPETENFNDEGGFGGGGLKLPPMDFRWGFKGY